MMQDDPNVFDEVSITIPMLKSSNLQSQYHIGFRSQSTSWPTNPVGHYIKTLSSSPKGTVIADLGCGDATLASALLPKGLIVLSYDLVSRDMNGLVVQVDICGRIPLPGSEDEEKTASVQGQVVDVCVCSLSLMSTNWVGCIKECWRILKMGSVGDIHDAPPLLIFN
jgi:ribosomal RNA-processing protein 8